MLMWLEPFLGSSSPPSSPLLPQSLLLFLTSVWKCALRVANKSTWLIMPLQFDSWLGWQVKLPVWISGTEWEETELVWSRGDGRGEESVLVGSSPLRLSILSDLCLLWCAKNKWSSIINALSLSICIGYLASKFVELPAFLSQIVV